ncbi:MAG: chemotaxis-specific protein-glutamate methyltransferase CheB [Candidatus Hodarchaeota archaeon]
MQKINVLIVDDSGFQRILLQNMLRDDPRIGKIRFGHDGQDGVQKTVEFSPDVVILDIIMPRMDGITALKEIMTKKPTPVLLLSALSKHQVSKALKGGLEGGAVDFLQKPTKKSEWLESQQQTLISKVIAASRANVKRLQNSISSNAGQQLPPREDIKELALTQKAIIFAASTGGPQTLGFILSQLPRTTPPIFVIQHIGEGFTKSLAKTLNLKSEILVKEAVDRQNIQHSTAFVAPGGKFHMEIHSEPNLSICLAPGPPMNFVRPAANVTMNDAAKIFGKGTLGVILTGMGTDALEGAWAIKNAGGKIIVEAPESCVVQSMPLKVIKAGLADIVAPKEEIAAAIRQLGWL